MQRRSRSVGDVAPDASIIISRSSGGRTRSVEIVLFRHHPAAADQHQIGRVRREHIFGADTQPAGRSEEHTSELQSLMRISYAVFCLKKKKKNKRKHQDNRTTEEPSSK